MKSLNFAGGAKKEEVERAQLLMELSKRDLAEAKRLREEARRAKPEEREELLKKVLAAVGSSRKFAEEAERLLAR